MNPDICYACHPTCLDNPPEGPNTIPKFNTTYSNYAKNSYSNNFLLYDDGCGRCCESCEGRCKLMCNTISQEQRNYNVLQHSNNYIGTSKKMAYGKHARTTPGLYTFASKKIPSLQPTIKKAQLCFQNYWCKNL